MNTEPDEQEVVREAGSWYGTMAADLSLAHISAAATEETIQEHIADLARNIPEQACSGPERALGKILQLCGRVAPSEQFRPIWRHMGSPRRPRRLCLSVEY